MGWSSGVQPIASGAEQVLLLLEKLDSKDLKTNQPNKHTNKNKQNKTKQNKTKQNKTKQTTLQTSCRTHIGTIQTSVIWGW